MSAAPLLAFERVRRRAVPRHPIDVPLDVIALQSGIPGIFPGRCTDLSEVGVGAIVAGELAPGQQVALEFRLPDGGVPLQVRAQVRYEERLRCGLQFLSLSAEQREMIQSWAAHVAAQPVEVESPHKEAAKVEAPVEVAAAPDKEKRKRRIRVRRRRFYVLLAFMLALAGFGWWQWQRAWNELEAQASGATQPGSPLRVAPEVMERQIVYKVDPEYPEAARLAGTQGLVVLDVVIAADGTVKTVRSLAGPDLLAQSAINAVRSWRFEPYRSAGEAVEVETTLTVEFRLH